jgi:DNA-binding winged helix-turn-helix (wHTH) protein
MTFGLFEANLKTGERWKAGHRVKLQSQLFKALTVLRENAGEAVSREDLQLRVWGPDVAVDFGHSLGSAIKKVGEALGDSADNPHLIETPSRRGHRRLSRRWRNSRWQSFLRSKIVRKPLSGCHGARTMGS